MSPAGRIDRPPDLLDVPPHWSGRFGNRNVWMRVSFILVVGAMLLGVVVHGAVGPEGVARRRPRRMRD